MQITAMKRFFAIFAITVVVAGCASMAPVREEDKDISQVFEVPATPKRALYEKIKIWMAQNFKSSKSVIEYDNPDTGIIIGNGVVKYPCEGLECVAKHDWTVPFTMRVDIKDSRFRLSYTNLHVAWPAKSDSLGFHEASDHAMWQQGEYEAIRPVLLHFGDQILASIATEPKVEQW